jgi:hypothetical protein
MSTKIKNSLGLTAIFVLLSACGGGGTSTGGGIDPDVPPPVTLQNAAGTQQITVIASNGTPVNVTVTSSTLAQLNRIGATEQTYAAILADGRIIGLETLAANVPTSGTFTYNGNSVAVINDGSHFYDLVGSATATLTMANQSSDLDVTLNGFSGERTAVVGGATTNGTSMIYQSHGKMQKSATARGFATEASTCLVRQQPCHRTPLPMQPARCLDHLPMKLVVLLTW